MTQDTDPASGLVGTVLAGRYRILEKLGEGAMGAVYLGEHLKIGRRDAIKVLRDMHARDTEAIARFLRGARNVSTIHHPNVCGIYDFSDAEGGLQFLAMEYIAGETLKDTLDREKRLPLERALQIAKQVASGLDAAHDVGIIHRDLKPGNIMLVAGRDGRDHIKVVDFDIAKGPDTGGEEVTRLGFVVGTPEYMSPEQLMGEQLDGRSDVYSLAIVLFRMLTGTLPFRGETTQDLMIQRLTHPPLTVEEALPGAVIPERLRSLLDRALQRRPADRIVSAADFEQEVVLLLAEGAQAGSPRQPATGKSAAASVQSAYAGAEVPLTRVSTATSAPLEATRALASSGAPPRRKLGLAVGVGAVVVVAGLGLGAVLLRNGGTEVSAPPEPPVTIAAADSSPVESQVANPGQTTPVRDQPTPTRQVVAAIDSSNIIPVSNSERPPSTPIDPRPRISIPADRVGDVLLEQLETLDSQPAPRALDAVTDTAMAVWQNRAFQANDRALAAYVLASVYAVRSEWGRCARWLDSALVLTPGDEGFKRLRTNCPQQNR